MAQIDGLIVNEKCTNQYICNHMVIGKLRGQACFEYKIDRRNSSNCCCGDNNCHRTEIWDALDMIITCDQTPIAQEAALARNQGKIYKDSKFKLSI